MQDPATHTVLMASKFASICSNKRKKNPLYAQTSKQKRAIIVVNTYRSYHFQNSVHTQVDDPMPEPKVAWESRTNC